MRNIDLITSALRQLGVLSEVEDPSPEQAATALEVMNDFLEEWSADGIDIGQWPQTELQGEFPGDRSSEHVVKNNLCVYLAPHFERQPHPVTVAAAQAGYARLLRDAVKDRLKPVDVSHLPMGAGQSTGNILTDD